MTRVKVAKATGHTLDWMVAKAEYTDRRVELSPYGGVYFEHSPGSGDSYNMGWTYARFSTDWSQGGPIIDRKFIALNILRAHEPSKRWMASPNGGDNTPSIPQYGPTALTAAMRCFVASKLGDEVDVPEELL